jgi:DNA repair exonuclease SbcCD ATPase subunit
VALLYGQLRSDLKIQRRLDPWVEQYKPWHSSEYGGILWCRLADGRELELHRSFGKDETQIEIRTASGEDITREYEQQRNGDVLFARFHFGLPKELYESIGIIRESRVAEINGQDTIRDRIANLAQSGDEELSIRRSLAAIQDMLDSIGSERAPTKPYKQAMDLVQSLQAERKALEDRKILAQSWVEERNRMVDEISRLERDLLHAQKILFTARRKEISCKVRNLEDLENEIGGLRTEMQALNARPDFPSEQLDALTQQIGLRGSLESRLKEIQSEKESALEQLARLESEKRELENYSLFAASADAEKVTERFVSYLGFTLQKDGLQKTAARLNEEMRLYEMRIQEQPSALREPASDWQSMAREAAEDEQAAFQQSSALGEKIAAARSNVLASERTVRNRRIAACLLLVVAAVPVALRFLVGYNQAMWVEAGLSGVFIILSILMLLGVSRAQKAVRDAEKNLISLNNEQNHIREAGSEKRNRLNEIMFGAGFKGLDEFLTAAKKTEQDRQRLSDLRARLAEVEQQIEKLQSQSIEIYNLLKESLAQAGLSCSPGNLKFQIDIFRANLRRFREIQSAYSNYLNNCEALKAKEETLTKDYNQSCSCIQTCLDQADVGTIEEFRSECRKKQRLFELAERESSRNREFQRLAGDRTLSQWKDQLDQLEQNSFYSQGETVNPEESAEGEEPLLPYLPSISEAEEEEKRISSRLAGAREEFARSVERLNHVFQNYRLSSEIEEDLAVAEREFEQLEKNRIALNIALETLEKLARQQQETLAPQLNAGVEQRFLRLCGRRYEEVKIDPDFQVWVREADSGELRLSEHLSRGTQDQIYFAIRFGILDLVSNEGEPCPCLLDEPFAAYDRARLEEAFEILLEEARSRQLILFTCREDLLELAQRHEIHVQSLV